MRHRARRLAVATVILLLVSTATLLAPAAQANPLRIHEPLVIEGALGIPAAGAGALELAVFAAATEVTGEATGPIFHAGDVTSIARIQAATVRVWDRDDIQALVEGRPVLEVQNGAVEFRGNSLYYGTHDHAVHGTNPFGLSFLFDVMGTLPPLGDIDSRGLAPYEPTLVAAVTGPWLITSDASDDPGGRQWLLPLGVDDEGNGFTVETPGGDPQPFRGTRYFLTLRGQQAAAFTGGTIAIPTGPETVVMHSRATTEAFEAGLTQHAFDTFLDSIERVRDDASGLEMPEERPPENDDQTRTRGATNDALQTILGATPIDLLAVQAQRQPGDQTGDPAGTGGTQQPTEGSLPIRIEALADMGDFANGMVLGRFNATMRIGGAFTEAGPLSIIRFETLRIDGFTPGGAVIQGTTPLAFTDGHLQQGEDPVTLGPLILPTVSIVLYALALIAWLASRFWQARDKDDALSNRMRRPARITYWVTLVIASILFDREIELLLGTSILDLLFGGLGESSLAVAGIVAGIQLSAWAAAVAFVGVPFRIMGRAGLKMAGFTKATNGFASALAPLIGWLWGSHYVVPFLDAIASQSLGQVATAASIWLPLLI